jgi:hypothetical protein
MILVDVLGIGFYDVRINVFHVVECHLALFLIFSNFDLFN